MLLLARVRVEDAGFLPVLVSDERAVPDVARIVAARLVIGPQKFALHVVFELLEAEVVVDYLFLPAPL